MEATMEADAALGTATAGHAPVAMAARRGAGRTATVTARAALKAIDLLAAACRQPWQRDPA